MLPKVRCRGLVSFILKASNALCLAPAVLGSAGKEMGDAAIIPLDGNVWLKKGIYCGTPSFLSCSLRIKSVMRKLNEASCRTKFLLKFVTILTTRADLNSF